MRATASSVEVEGGAGREEPNSSATSAFVMEVFWTRERGRVKEGLPATRNARSSAAFAVFSGVCQLRNCAFGRLRG